MKLRKIIINGKALAKRYKTGVQRYCIEILRELDKISNEINIEIVIPKYSDFNERYSNIKIIKYGKLQPNIWEQIELPRYVKKEKNAILVNLCNTSPLTRPDIVCVHDISFVKNFKFYPKKFAIWYYLNIKNAVQKSKKIITVSNFSKSEIEEYYNIKNIDVIYDSYEHIERLKADYQILDKYKLKNEKYFFTLGTIQKNKNIEWIIEVAKRNPREQFVITGYKNQKIKEDVNNIVYTGYLKDEEIKALMEKCKAYITPSLYEGFGIPPLEAFSLNKKILVSDIPVMHEIFEDEVTYFDPYSYEINLNEIKESMNRKKILEKFSWKKSAEKLLKIIEEVDNKG